MILQEEFVILVFAAETIETVILVVIKHIFMIKKKSVGTFNALSIYCHLLNISNS